MSKAPRSTETSSSKTVSLHGNLPQAPELVDKATLCERLNISVRTIENMVAAGTFPPPVRVGKRVYWSEIAVRNWHRRMFAAQEAWTSH